MRSESIVEGDVKVRTEGPLLVVWARVPCDPAVLWQEVTGYEDGLMGELVESRAERGVEVGEGQGDEQEREGTVELLDDGMQRARCQLGVVL